MLKTFSESIREATAQCMRKYKNVILIGEGVPDPKAIFGSTVGLEKEFGKKKIKGKTGYVAGSKKLKIPNILKLKLYK